MSIRLSVWIEIEGENRRAGTIKGNNSYDAVFQYDKEYMRQKDTRPISVSLPYQDDAFDMEKTRNFFDGLLPEGYTRRCVAEEIHVDTQDYLSILANLGKECLGAIQILSENEAPTRQGYRRLDEKQLRYFAKEGASQSAALVTKSHLSLTGASGKAGLYYDQKNDAWYLPIGSSPSTHIVKQSHVRLSKIVANEQLCLLTAKKLGIEIPESFIVPFDNMEDENILFATKRYDRTFGGYCESVKDLIVPHRLHQEDFSQALGISAMFKYEKDQDGYFVKIFDLLRKHSSNPLEDQIKLWDICIFNYFVGNTDNHIKNISLLYGDDLKSIRLAPAYDIISTICYESSTEEMAISIDGIYNIKQITRQNFENEANKANLGVRFVMKRFDQMKKNFEKALRQSAEELKKEGFVDIQSISEKILGHFYSLQA